ncbi:hypothetical protein BHM03_00014837 [Ensete ventricosum]|nr:hypothetical protein BHM03_00014837 [Ensete ventricosum]
MVHHLLPSHQKHNCTARIETKDFDHETGERKETTATRTHARSRPARASKSHPSCRCPFDDASAAVSADHCVLWTLLSTPRWSLAAVLFRCRSGVGEATDGS